MKLIVIIMIVTLMQVSAATFGQNISLKKGKLSLEKVFKEIRKQTGYNIFLSSDEVELSTLVSVDFNNTPLTTVVSKVLLNLPLTYTIDQKTIVIKEEKKAQINSAVAIDLTGTILDEKNVPMVSAVIKLKGSNRVVMTDSQGKFRFPDLSEKDTIVISYVGYKPLEIAVKGKFDILIRLEIAERELDQISIVSTGYQNIPKERATGSFKVLSQEQLDKPATNIAQRLVGTTAGLQSTVDANGNTTFRVRGQTSLNASSEPLVVVDGFPIQGSINNLNPNNIETITLLKDAAAASIWGSRSANGVIVITTKNAKKGTPLSVDISSFTRIANKVDLNYVRPQATSAETVDFERLGYGKWGGAANAGTLASLLTPWSAGYTLMNEQALGYISIEQRDAALERLKTLDNKGQISDLLLTNPISNQVNLNIAGSSGHLNNVLSLLYETNKTNFKGTDNTRAVINYNTSANITKWLDFDLNTMFLYRKSNNNGVSLSDLQSISPYEMLLNEDGSYGNVIRNFYTPALQRYVPVQNFPYSDFSYNPLREVNARNFSAEDLQARVQAGLTAKIIKGLSLSSKIQYENFTTTNRNLANEDSYQVRYAINTTSTWNRTLTGAVSPNLPKGSILDQNRSKIRGYVFRNQLNFNRDFGSDHSINFIGGTELRSTVIETFNNPTTYGYNDETLTVGAFPNGPGGTFPRFPTYSLTNILGQAVSFGYTNSFSYRTDRYFSSFANLGYTFKNKYTISGSFRTDGSNLIASDPKFRYSPFWSVGGSWRIDRETFVKDISWVDKLTARLTYGYNGNEDRSTSPTPLISIAATPNSVTNENTATIASFGNPTLRWEKTGTINAGVDFSLFDGKLYGTLEYYNKKGKDLLASLSIPSVNGTTTQRLNNVQMYNKGVDIELGSALRINKDIAWRGNVTFSYNKNRITDLFVVRYTAIALRSGGSGAYVEGIDANTLWAYKYNGFVGGVPVVQAENGGTYTLTAVPSADGRTFMQNAGVSVAPYTMGLMSAFDIYDFNVSFIFTGKFGHVFRRMSFNYPAIDFGKTIPNSRLTEVLNGDPSQIVTLPVNPNEPNYRSWGNGYVPYMDYLIENANHIRLQELNVSYNVKAAFLNKFKLTGLRLFAQGNNLFTMVNNTYNEDPEYPVGNLKPQPQFTFGFKLQL